MGLFHCAVLLLHGILTSVHGEFAVIVPGDGGFAAIVGGDAVLECQLVPDILTSDMEVQWRKSGLTSPVLVYRHGQSDALAQHQDYRARAQLFKDELAKGNISLRIMNVRRLDEGEYTCSVTDRTENEASPAQLRVQGLGSKPRIQLLGYQGDGIQLVCKSGGWYPGPEMLWIGEDGQVLPQAETRYHEDKEGLKNVESQVTVTRQPTNKFKCVVQNRRFNLKNEAIVKISDEIFPAGVPDWALPLVLTICLLIAANGAVLYWNVKQNRRIKELERRKSIVELEWKRIRGHQVSVTLDVETAHPWLEVSEDRKRVRWTRTRTSLPDTGKRFTDSPCVLGSEGFTSGRHYWEVDVAGCRSWSLGVAAESVEREGEVALTPDTGFWIIERVDDKFDALTSPPSRLPDRPIPGWVGVYLSCESGTVSFYDADTKSHLHTFTGNKFTKKCFPFFWTWDQDQWMTICSGSIPGYEDVQRAYVSVTLDVETAGPELEVSEDRKRVRWTETERSLPDTGKRFTVRPCVLGLEGFTSGRRYWEVEVAGSRRWRLGVAAESVAKKGRATPTPETGVWSIEQWDDEFVAVTSPQSPLPARPIPWRVGVYLSYESGTVSFYDADTKSLLHTFTGNKFTAKLYPFFKPWSKHKWLTICSDSILGYEDVQRAYVSITLDAETAHSRLEVSEDRKRVRQTETRRCLPDTGKRFTVRRCVLGSEGFTSGRHYWEVEVAESRSWSLGVAAESVEREGRVTLIPETGVWSIQRMDDEFDALTSTPYPLPARPIPGRVGVYLSYEPGTVSFYDADTKYHLHTFTGSKFTEKCYPFFWTWDEDKWLRICPGSIPELAVRSAHLSVFPIGRIL